MRDSGAVFTSLFHEIQTAPTPANRTAQGGITHFLITPKMVRLLKHTRVFINTSSRMMFSVYLQILKKSSNILKKVMRWTKGLLLFCMFIPVLFLFILNEPGHIAEFG